MADFGLIKSFGVDDGELDPFSRQECFVLGYELAQVDSLLKEGVEFSRPVHAANQQRIEDTFDKADRYCELRWMPGDSSESWMWLKADGNA